MKKMQKKLIYYKIIEKFHKISTLFLLIVIQKRSVNKEEKVIFYIWIDIAIMLGESITKSEKKEIEH